MKQSLKQWLIAHGYVIKSGTLEIFPSGNGLRLLLQKGFGWLAPDGNIKIRREELRQEAALAEFLYDLEENQSNWSEAKNCIDSELQQLAAAAGGAGDGKQEPASIEGFAMICITVSGGMVQTSMIAAQSVGTFGR